MQETAGNIMEVIGIGNNFLNRTQIAQKGLTNGTT
jgi:hypothetical protein